MAFGNGVTQLASPWNPYPLDEVSGDVFFRGCRPTEGYVWRISTDQLVPDRPMLVVVDEPPLAGAVVSIRSCWSSILMVRDPQVPV
jgi:hypothetical protein